MYLMEFIIGLVIFFLILFLIPNKDNKLRKQFDLPKQEMSAQVNEKRVRLQGQVTKIISLKTPIFEEEAVIYQSSIFRLSERSKRDSDLCTKEHDWRIFKEEIKKENFLIEGQGWYALVKVKNSVELLNASKNDINQVDTLISKLNKGDKSFTDIKKEVARFLEKYNVFSNHFLDDKYEQLRAKEQFLSEGHHITVVGQCTVEDAISYPELSGIIHPQTKKIIVVSGDKLPIYLTDDMNILFG